MYKQIIKQFEHALALKYLSIILVNKLLSLMDMGRGRDVRLATTRKKRKNEEGLNVKKEPKKKKGEAHARKKHASLPPRKTTEEIPMDDEMRSMGASRRDG
jgi:hypothetical protein